jgi:hypothetical protein
MITDIDALLYKAEAEYLQQQDLAKFKSQMFSLEQRLKIYELLRENEIEIFQPIANQLLITFPDEDQQKIERALKHWLSVLRYCGMAMLSNNQTYLQHRILEWLPVQIQAHQMESLEHTLFSFLQKRLRKTLSPEQFSLLQPFLEQAKTTLLD